MIKISILLLVRTEHLQYIQSHAAIIMEQFLISRARAQSIVLRGGRSVVRSIYIIVL